MSDGILSHKSDLAQEPGLAPIFEPFPAPCSGPSETPQISPQRANCAGHYHKSLAIKDLPHSAPSVSSPRCAILKSFMRGGER